MGRSSAAPVNDPDWVSAEDGFEELVGGFELAEAAFEVPLLGGFFAGVEEVGAGLGGFVGAELVFGAGRGYGFEIVARLPEAFAGLEAVLHSGANHLLQVGVVEVVGFHGADIFVCEVDAGDAFVVGGERNGHVVFAVDREWMIVAADAEDEVVAGEGDFDHDVIFRHSVHQLVGFLFVHDVDAVADALGVSELDGPVNVAAETFVGDDAGSEFAGMHGDVDLGIDRVEIVEHFHLLFQP